MNHKKIFQELAMSSPLGVTSDLSGLSDHDHGRRFLCDLKNLRRINISVRSLAKSQAFLCVCLGGGLLHGWVCIFVCALTGAGSWDDG